ncbi:MAG: AI-2E family transporter [Flavobacteriales bacterium]|nr:AI-2E family transporter [Flavobacteriales bacterium]
MSDPTGLQRYVNILLAVVLSVVVLYFGRSLILLVIGSGLLAFLLLPMARGLERFMPRWASALVSTLVVVVVVLGAFFFLGWQISRFGRDFPALQDAFSSKGELVLAWIEDNTQLDRREQIAWFNSHLSSFASVGGNAALSLFSGTGTVFASIAPIPIFVFLMLLLKDRFRTFFMKLGTTRDGAVLDVMVTISKLSRKYMRGMFSVVVIFAILASTGFLIIGLKYAILLGSVVAVLNVIPYVGALIGSLIPMTVALVSQNNPWNALVALGVVLVVQFLDNNFITPKVVGSSVSINPLASLVALISFGTLWGVAGMLLAIPLTGMLKVVCDSIPSLKPWGYLLGEDIETPKEKRLVLPFVRSRKKR